MSKRVLLLLLCVLLSACGVRAQDDPERLPPGVLPPELRPSAAPSAASTTAPVSLVDGDRLVRLEQPPG